jgi:hypothetical protein
VWLSTPTPCCLTRSSETSWGKDGSGPGFDFPRVNPFLWFEHSKGERRRFDFCNGSQTD